MAGLRSLPILALAFMAAAQQHVEFPAPDGVRIAALLYGRGARGVVLAHGGRFTMESWAPQASELAAHGFRSVAIEYRPGPENHRYLDILAAIRYLRRTGSSFVAVVGASMGGDYAAEAANSAPSEIDRLVLLASGAYTPVDKMRGPKLFILAHDDANAEGPRLPRIRAQYEKALPPKELIVLDGSAHAQFLFQSSQGPRLMAQILEFLSAP